MAVNAFLSFFDKAKGESIQKGHEHWVELQSWDWEIEAATTWTKGGGAMVAKPVPGAMRWQHDFDASSSTIMGAICTGKAFPKVQIDVVRPAGGGAPIPSLTVLLEGVFITKVTLGLTDAGRVTQRVEMVFKTIKIDSSVQDPKTGKVTPAATFNWDIPAGTASPSA